jgi:hypothetical protein
MHLLRAARASSRWSKGSTKGERRERPAAMMRMGCRQPSMLRESERQLGGNDEAIRRRLASTTGYGAIGVYHDDDGEGPTRGQQISKEEHLNLNLNLDLNLHLHLHL